MDTDMESRTVSGFTAKGLSRRGVKGIWQHTRRVPKRYAHLENRPLIRTSLHTEDLALAQAKATQIGMLQNQEWELALHGRGTNLRQAAAYTKAQKIADLRGFTYLPANEIAQLPLEQICERIKISHQEPLAAPALLGTETKPELKTADWLTVYSDHISEKLENHSADQRKRWELARMRSLRNFEEAVGPRAVRTISRSEALGFRKWWRSRMEQRGLTANTANKDFAYLSAMWNTLAKFEGWPEQNPFRSLAFEEVTKPRLAFSSGWIQHQLLDEEKLKGLNQQARDILLLMINTGARPSELIGLEPRHIQLSDEIPHIQIQGANKKLKTKYSQRDIPLVGCSLQAMGHNPQGFDRYRGKAAHWSNTVSKFLRQNDLLESESHSPYSLRHSLSDRLQNAGCEDRTRKEIMGHRPEGIIYGSGSTLEVKAKWLHKVGFK